MSAISDNLIHFLARNDKESPNRQFSIFKLIIENGLRTSRAQIKFSEGASVFNHIIRLQTSLFGNATNILQYMENLVLVSENLMSKMLVAILHAIFLTTCPAKLEPKVSSRAVEDFTLTYANSINL